MIYDAKSDGIIIFSYKEPVLDILKKNGFSVWGGGWNDPLDWQHFQPSRTMAQLLSIMSPDDASDFFELYADRNQLLNAWDFKDQTLENLYKKNPVMFMVTVKAHPEILDMMPDVFKQQGPFHPLPPLEN